MPIPKNDRAKEYLPGQQNIGIDFSSGDPSVVILVGRLFGSRFSFFFAPGIPVG